WPGEIAAGVKPQVNGAGIGEQASAAGSVPAVAPARERLNWALSDPSRLPPTAVVVSANPPTATFAVATCRSVGLRASAPVAAITKLPGAASLASMVIATVA